MVYIGLPQEYWRPKILFAIARWVGIPLSLDDATINKTLDHFARVLVDMDLFKPLQDQIMVERKEFAFHVRIEYEYLPPFCNSCSIIGHSISDCKKNQFYRDGSKKDNNGSLAFKKSGMQFVPKSNGLKFDQWQKFQAKRL